ncbi:bifunctional biotin--[acetyl-CoA-carboxylase] ligase/biotin operon repressor BirA [Thaumasiovibrio subtropicus]|uniref:bifunctional biotin--[acetyl-CoA-carboxylase] ligase/biotin operon repressor BirA n=1 Tax=Thaumasiovibrio subtropicus TaxID=1891207 RepID=UPI000B363B16|nr:bifunctional biotin--[acetyl-CoA-carboxylase] ligase/biotin operon repressor BirA [Thaumasiovibrio subtropicus]
MTEHLSRLQIIELLSDGQFHSGQKIGDSLGISRAAVNKHIQVLKEWGIDIFRIQGKGYQLAIPFELLDRARLQQDVGEAQFELIPVIDSTNQYLLDKGASLQSGHCCVAELQTAGRGRRGRAWYSPFGSNIYLSMYWRLDAGMAAAMGLSLVVGVIAAETLREVTGADVKVKWPNDLYVDDKKLAGILVELTGQAGDAAHVVMGMGINFSMENETSVIDQPWTSLVQACQHMPSRNTLVATLINRLRTGLAEYELQGLNAFLSRWNTLDNYLGRAVKIIMGERVVEGVARGITPQGGLMLEMPNGEQQTFVGGEVSLRGNDAITD